MTKTQAKAIEKMLNDINIDIYATDIKDIKTIEEFEEFLQENNYFDVEIIYYYNAIEYLKENDPSLKYSLGIAFDHGFKAENLNSELLASLLASQKIREEFEEIKNDIKEIIE